MKTLEADIIQGKSWGAGVLGFGFGFSFFLCFFFFLQEGFCVCVCVLLCVFKMDLTFLISSREVYLGNKLSLSVAL